MANFLRESDLQVVLTTLPQALCPHHELTSVSRVSLTKLGIEASQKWLSLGVFKAIASAASRLQQEETLMMDRLSLGQDGLKESRSLDVHVSADSAGRVCHDQPNRLHGAETPPGERERKEELYWFLA